MASSEWTFKTARELSNALLAKKVSSLELAQDAIAQIERHDAKINAICVRDFSRAGVQIVEPWLEHRTPLKLAELIEQNFGGFVAPPGFS